MFLSDNPLASSVIQIQYYAKIVPVCSEFETSFRSLESFCASGEPTLGNAPDFIKDEVVGSFTSWFRTIDDALRFIFDNRNLQACVHGHRSAHKKLESLSLSPKSINPLAFLSGKPRRPWQDLCLIWTRCACDAGLLPLITLTIPRSIASRTLILASSLMHQKLSSVCPRTSTSTTSYSHSHMSTYLWRPLPSVFPPAERACLRCGVASTLSTLSLVILASSAVLALCVLFGWNQLHRYTMLSNVLDHHVQVPGVEPVICRSCHRYPSSFQSRLSGPQDENGEAAPNGAEEKGWLSKAKELL